MEPYRILVADDDPNVHQSLNAYFRREGYQIISAFDGEQAVQQAQLIVIDEIGRLERDAARYCEALSACLDGDVPVLGAIRLRKADWADFARRHPAVALLEVTPDNRDDVPRQAMNMLMKRAATGDTTEDGYGHFNA